MSETEKHLDKGYIIFRYSGVYDDDHVTRGMVALMATTLPEEVLNFRAMIVDLSAVSEIGMANSDGSNHNQTFQKMKRSLDLKGLNILDLTSILQRLIICPAHLRGAWSERMKRIQTAALLPPLPDIVYFDTLDAAVAAVNPV